MARIGELTPPAETRGELTPPAETRGELTCRTCGGRVPPKYAPQPCNACLEPGHRIGGMVYLAYAPRRDVYKIGHTRGLINRRAALQATLGGRVDVLAVFPGEYEAEARAHAAFQSSRAPRSRYWHGRVISGARPEHFLPDHRDEYLRYFAQQPGARLFT
jgi:hypothetical protein